MTSATPQRPGSLRLSASASPAARPENDAATDEGALEGVAPVDPTSAEAGDLAADVEPGNAVPSELGVQVRLRTAARAGTDDDQSSHPGDERLTFGELVAYRRERLQGVTWTTSSGMRELLDVVGPVDGEAHSPVRATAVLEQFQ